MDDGGGGMKIEQASAASLGSTIPFPVGAQTLQASPDFIEKLPLAIYACDAAGRILWFNSRAAILWGRVPMVGDDSEKFCGSHRLYFDGRQISREETPMAAVLRTGEAIRGAEGRVERPDGSSVWATVHIEPVKDDKGRLIGAINCFHESTALHQAAELLREQDRRLAATYEHAGSGIVEVDAEGKLLRVNARLCELTGRTAEELIGRSIFDETVSADVDEDREQFLRQVNGEIERYTIEKRIVRKQGGSFWASVTSSSVRDADGRFLYAVRVQQDITERKQAQAQLALRAQEQTVLHRLTEQLQHALSLGDVHQAALDAMVDALHCQRASILLFDKAGVMRFVAWRGLSDAYRAAVEGHSPWTPDADDPQPICIDSVERADLPPELKQAIGKEGIEAIAFIPLRESGRLLGKFMIYYDHPHVFAESELEIARTLSHQLAFGIERIRAQKAAQQLISIVESSHDAIISKDLDGIITTWNRGAERLFGYSADEVIGKSITILIPEERLGEETDILARIRRGDAVDHFETVRRRKDGSPVDISLTISPVRDAKGRIVGASKIARDITEQKEAEARIRESEQRLQDLLAAIPAAIYTTDAEGRITYFNQAAVELAGRTPVLGSDEWCVTWKLLWPDGRPLPHDECPMAISLREGRPVRGMEAVAERPDGTQVPFIPYPTPMHDAHGKVVGGINMLVDISERKQAETQQRVLLNELNHRVKNNMQMLQSLLNTAAKQSRSEEAQRILSEAGGRIAAMAAAQRVLYDTTDATRFSAPHFLESVCQTAEQTFPSHVKIDCRAVPGVLSNDVAMPLALIVNELLTNAVKHGVNGSSQATIRVALSREGDDYVLSVEDDGAGFDLDAVRPVSSGLRLVEGLARQLRGTFAVSRGAGTRCSLTFC
jgi:PAS domain S-box-containing protein